MKQRPCSSCPAGQVDKGSVTNGWWGSGGGGGPFDFGIK